MTNAFSSPTIEGRAGNLINAGVTMYGLSASAPITSYTANAQVKKVQKANINFYAPSRRFAVVERQRRRVLAAVDAATMRPPSQRRNSKGGAG